MTKLVWDAAGERFFETGVDQGVLYIPTAGVYDTGYAWNGLTGVTESPSGAEPTPLWADNTKYVTLMSAEEFAGTIEAYTYPDAFAQCDGTAVPHAGVMVGQQARKTFGLSYRTKLGNDESPDKGYKLHLVYGCLASPSEKAYASVNDSPEAITFSWGFSTTPVAVTGLKPTSLLTIDSTTVASASLTALEDLLYGTGGTDARLPDPDTVIALFAGAPTLVVATAPTFVGATGVITIPTVTGVRYRRADTNAVVTGTVTISGGAGASLSIQAEPLATYALGPSSDDDWTFVRTA